MGNVASRDIYANKTGPNTGTGLDTLSKNQGAFRETLGALPPKEVTILDGAISGFEEAALIVDTEGGGAADDLEAISPVISATENLHNGMLITLRAKDPARAVTVKNSAAANGINTADGNDIVLSPDWELTLRLVGGRWYEVPGRASAQAAEAQADAATALGRTDPATTTSRGIARVATLADMEPGAEVENGPAFLAAGSDALNALVPTFLIGSIISTYAADGYVPNGCVLPDGAEYTQSQFPSLYTDYLVAGKIVTCTYTEFGAQVALTGNCGKFALDTVNKKFKVPLLKDGDSITQAASVGEMGKSYKAGLPNITGSAGGIEYTLNTTTGALYKGANVFGISSANNSSTMGSLCIDASRSSSIYGNSTTVTDEQVRLRHFVVLASAQNSASVFDWSNYMAGLAGKANNDLSNLTPAAVQVIKNSMTASAISTCTTTGDWTITGCKIGVPLDIICDVLSVDGNGNNTVNLYTKSGATGGTGGAAVFGLVRANAWYSTNVFRCYPTNSTVVISVDKRNGVRLTAMQ